MHPYSSDFPHRPKLFAFLFVSSGTLASLLAMAAGKIHATLGFTLGGVSAMTIYGLLHLWLDGYLWRLAWLRKALLVPDLNGTWIVQGSTVYGPPGVICGPWTGELTVLQSWSKIKIIQTTAQSVSRSDSASIYHIPPEGFMLAFQYGNKPQIGEKALSQHSGACRIVFSDDGKSGQGEYFNDQHRGTAGSMSLTRKNAK